jgi:hypothetical protein
MINICQREKLTQFLQNPMFEVLATSLAADGVQITKSILKDSDEQRGGSCYFFTEPRGGNPVNHPSGRPPAGQHTAS